MEEKEEVGAEARTAVRLPPPKSAAVFSKPPSCKLTFRSNIPDSPQNIQFTISRPLCDSFLKGKGIFHSLKIITKQPSMLLMEIICHIIRPIQEVNIAK